MAVAAASGYPQYSGNLITPLFSMELLEQFYCSSIYSDISTTEYSGELVNCGDQITFWKEPEVRIRDTTKNAPIVHDTLDSEPLTMVVDKAKDFSIKISQIDEKQICNWDSFKAAFLKRASYQLAQSIDQTLLAQMYTEVNPSNQGANAGVRSGDINLGETGAPVALTADNILDTLLAIHTVLDEQCAPTEGRFVVLPPKAILLLQTSDLRSALVTGLGESPLVNGRLPGTVAGFNVLRSINVPTTYDTGAGATAHHIVAGVKMATAFAAQIEKTRVIEDKDDWSTFYQGLSVYGFKVMYDKALAHLYARLS